MIKFLAALRKEWLILIRDIPGLGILFLMPVLLILVVTMAQEKALKSQAEPTPVGISAPPGSPLGKQIHDDFQSSGIFRVHSDSLSPSALTEAIRKGDVPIGIIISPEDSSVTLMIDPILHETFRATLRSAAVFLCRSAEGKVVMRQMIAISQPQITIDPESLLNDLPPIYEKQAVKEKSAITPTPIQNNIPGFIMFAMFFIVIPLSGSLINEKREGPYLRLKTLPVPLGSVMGAKVLLYLIVCLIQFLFMILIGIYLFHLLFDLPRLAIGSSFLALVVATLAAAFAAVGFGLLVGAGSRSHAQAALFGSVMVVILGIISGTFLPIHLMPKTIQMISSFSPLRWGIDNYLELFIRDGTLIDILPRTLWLLLFFIFAMLTSMSIFAKRNEPNIGL